MLDKQFAISYAPKDEGNVSRLAEQLYYEDLNGIKDIEENTVTFKTMYMFETGNKVEVKVFIVNCTDYTVNFDFLSFDIKGEDGELLASETVNLEDVGEIPSKHARPFSLFFSKGVTTAENKINDNCKLIINHESIVARGSNRVNVNYIDDNISLYEKRILEKYLQGIPPIVKGDIKLMPYKSGIDGDKSYYTILVVINGSDENVKLVEFSMVYKDHLGFTQAHKRVNSLPKVNANSISVYKVTLDKKEILRETFDIERCKLIIK